MLKSYKNLAVVTVKMK